ncbi:MAG TPA: PEP-utilizing enzyme [Actinomycetota bacterium]|nr:PEP-utilizing enzyme [Actinomycetota bacterium]
MTGPFTLDDVRAFDARVAGAKAAGLARAAAAHLPVLPAHIVPIEVLAPALAAGASALGRSPASARLAVAASRIDPVALETIRTLCAPYPHGAIVRSSSPLEHDPRWSGAFTTYHEVGVDDLETALLGCAASVFSRDVVGRCEQLGVPVSELMMGALIQPWLPLDGGGTATAADDAVSIHGVAEDPAALVAGAVRGERAFVRSGRSVEGDPGLGGLGPDVAFRVAALTDRVSKELGARTIEWGLASGTLWLLQVRDSASVPAGRRAPAIAPRRAPTDLERRLAAFAQRFPGPMGEATVLPLAPALDLVPVPARIDVEDPASTLREILAIAAALRSTVWNTDPTTAERRWWALARDLLAGTPTPADLGELRAPDAAETDRLTGLVEGLGRSLTDAGSLTHPALVWRMAPAHLEAAVRRPGHRPPVPHGPDRWESLIANVVCADGAVTEGVGASPGFGAGPAHPLVLGAGMPAPRSVLVAPRPIPQIAPLLWGCAGLVTSEGSEGAHLFEVARSLGVPAVTSLRGGGPGAFAPGSLIAVDGDGGAIAVLEPSTAASIHGVRPAQAGA